MSSITFSTYKSNNEIQFIFDCSHVIYSMRQLKQPSKTFMMNALSS